MGLNPDDPRAPYQQIAAELEAQIVAGKWKPGEQMPSVRALAVAYGVGNGAVQSAFRELRGAGLVTSWQGKGTIVRDPASRKAPADPEAAAVMAALEVLAGRVEGLEAQVAVLTERLGLTGSAPPGEPDGPGGPSGG